MRIRIRNTGFLSFIIAGAVAGAAKGVTVSATLGFILYEYIEGIAVVNICMCSSRAVSPGAARLETKYLGGRIMPPPPVP